MWTCPKCGRAFKKQNKSHYCGKAPETVEDYILAQPEEAQPHLKAIRNVVYGVLKQGNDTVSIQRPDSVSADS